MSHSIKHLYLCWTEIGYLGWYLHFFLNVSYLLFCLQIYDKKLKLPNLLGKKRTAAPPTRGRDRH